MPRNTEIKARLGGAGPSLAEVADRAAALATQPACDIAQDDTFFRCDNGRLKLRTFADGSGELIHYRRDDTPGPKESSYVLAPVADAAALREALSRAWGQVGRVRKRRTLVMCGRTRIHLDRVEDLGDFLELEVVLRDDESVEAGRREAHDLLRKLGVGEGSLVSGAYLDLLRAQG